MSFTSLSDAGFQRMMQFKKENRPEPAVITELKEKIERATQNAELVAKLSGQVPEDLVREIVAMRLEKDGLYMQWFEGKLTDTAPKIIIAT